MISAEERYAGVFFPDVYLLHPGKVGREKIISCHLQIRRWPGCGISPKGEAAGQKRAIGGERRGSNSLSHLTYPTKKKSYGTVINFEGKEGGAGNWKLARKGDISYLDRFVPGPCRQD